MENFQIELLSSENNNDDGYQRIINSNTADDWPTSEISQSASSTPRQQQYKTYHFPQPKRWLLFYALLALVLSAVLLAIGVAAFAVTPFSIKSNSSGLQIECKWCIIVVLFAGLSALLLYQKPGFVCLSATLLFSVVCVPLAVLSSVFYAINLYYRSRDTTHLHLSQTAVSSAAAFEKIDISLCVLSALVAVNAALIYRFSLQMTSINYKYSNSAANSHRCRSTLLGLMALISGILMTTFWATIEALTRRSVIDEYIINNPYPTGEVLCHGVIVAISGYLQVMAASKPNQPLLFCTAVANAVSLVLSGYFAAYPLNAAYRLLTVNHKSSDHLYFTKVIVCLLLSLCYILTLAVSLYSFSKFIKTGYLSRLPRLAKRQQQQNKFLRILLLLHPCVGVAYAILEVLTLTLLYVNNRHFDFNGVAVLILASSWLVYVGTRSRSPLLLSTGMSMCALCVVLSFRSVCLFAYYSIAKASRSSSSPDQGADVSSSSSSSLLDGPRISVHFLSATLALGECVVAALIIAACWRQLINCCRIQLADCRRKTRLLQQLLMWTAVLQSLAAAVSLFIGIKIFLVSNQDFGDRTVTFALYFLFTSIVSVFAARRQTALLHPAVVGQLWALVLLWQQANTLTYLIQSYSSELVLKEVHFQFFHDDHHFGLHCIVLLFFLIYFLFSFVYLLMAGVLIENNHNNSATTAMTHNNNGDDDIDDDSSALEQQLFSIKRESMIDVRMIDCNRQQNNNSTGIL